MEPLRLSRRLHAASAPVLDCRCASSKRPVIRCNGLAQTIRTTLRQLARTGGNVRGES